MSIAWADWRRHAWIGVLAVALLMLALIVGRSWLSERLVPDPRMTQRLEQAQAALVAGKLSANDGSGARELFESVLAMDPDQMRAHEGLVAVREAAIARAQRALQAHRLREASEHLDLARALSAPQVQLQPLQARLLQLREASSDTAAQLARAVAPGADEAQALAIFRQVLAVDADNATALDGRDRLLARRLVHAEAELEQGRTRAAQALVESVIAEDPGHLDLPPMRARLGEALAALQSRQQAELALAQRDRRAGRWDRAARRYQDLLQTDPGLVAASTGLRDLANALALRAQRQAANFEFESARASIERARRWSPEAPQLAAADRRLERSRQSRQRLPRPAGKTERARLPDLLAEASAAVARGDLISPPGASAWDRMRVAAAIAPESPELRRIERDFAQASRRCFDQALAEGKLGRAQACLEALVLQDRSPASEQARSDLAERWLAYGQERIGAGDWSEAERALVKVRRWRPGHAGLREAEDRLRTARRSAP